MSYDAETDSYTCAAGRKLVLLSEHPDKNSKNGAIVSRYRCEDCCNCHLRSQCSTSKNPCSPKEICVKKQFVEKRETLLENIKSEEGIYLRMCRSIQVEGAFALLKTDFGFAFAGFSQEGINIHPPKKIEVPPKS